MKVRIQLNVAATKAQIEVPKTAKFGKKEKTLKLSKPDGSLHFFPGRVKTVTEDEFEYIKKFEETLFGQLRVVGYRPAKPKAEKAPASQPEEIVEETSEKKSLKSKTGKIAKDDK